MSILVGMTTGLFYADFASDPFFNMAFDEWLFKRAHSHPSAFYLRLYSWQPGGITLGFNQRLETALDFSKVGATPVIRRITGGRALYHDPSELTYCVVINCEGWTNFGRLGSTASVRAELSQALMTFLAKFGIDARLVKPTHTDQKEAQMLHTAPCFASHARHEITSAGKKIVASAQRQTGNVMLQHGAIKINGLAAHPALASGIIDREQNQDIQPLTESEFQLAAKLFRESFSDYFSVNFALSSLSQSERKTALREAGQLKEKSTFRREMTKQTESAHSL